MIFPKAVNSGVIFEAGYAFALGMPMTFFVKSREDLPFMLRHADEHKERDIKILTYAGFDEIVQMLQDRSGF